MNESSCSRSSRSFTESIVSMRLIEKCRPTSRSISMKLSLVRHSELSAITASLVAARLIADARRAAAHQDDRLVAGLLQPVQHHDRDQVPDMQRPAGAVIAD